MLLTPPQVVRSSWRYCLVLRSWISTWTRRTRPPVAVACPSITNCTPDATTRPSIGLTMVVSIGRGRRVGVEVVEGDPAGVLAALVHAVAADEQAAGGGLHGLVALEGVRARVPLQRLAVGRVEGADVVAADHRVAEAVAGQALPGAVADVVEAGPGVGRGRRLLEAEVAADVDRPLGDGDRVDAVEVARDPQRLDVVVAGHREGDGGVVDRRAVAAGAAADHEVLVVGGDVAGVDPLDAADELEVVVPQAGAPGQQLVGLGADQADAVAVLVGDLAAGVDHQQLGVVVGELELLDGEHAVDADAAGHVVDEAGDDRAGGAVDGDQADAGGAVDGLELAADVHGGVGGGQGGGLGAGVGGEAGDRGAGGQVERGDLALGDAVDGVEGAGDVQLGAVRRGLDRVRRRRRRRSAGTRCRSARCGSCRTPGTAG